VLPLQTARKPQAPKKALKSSAFPNNSIKPPQKPPPIQLFHFVPLCSAKNFFFGTAKLPLGAFTRNDQHPSTLRHFNNFHPATLKTPAIPTFPTLLRFVTLCYTFYFRATLQSPIPKG
jgi:hypothetical protein